MKIKSPVSTTDDGFLILSKVILIVDPAAATPVLKMLSIFTIYEPPDPAAVAVATVVPATVTVVVAPATLD